MNRLLRSPDGENSGGGAQATPQATTVPSGDSAPSSSTPATTSPREGLEGVDKHKIGFMESLQEIIGKKPAQAEPQGEEAADPETKKEAETTSDWDINEKAVVEELGLKDLPATPATKALLAKHAELATRVEGHAARQTQLEQMLLTNDVEGLRRAGFDLPFDTRTPEDKYNEVVEYHSTVKNFADPLLDKLHELSRAGEPY